MNENEPQTEIIELDQQCLTREEVLEIEIGNLKKQATQNKIEALQQQRQAFAIQQQNHKVMSENSSLNQRLLNIDINQQQIDLRKITDEYKDKIELIKQKYGIEGDRWGFDPDTGLIKSE